MKNILKKFMILSLGLAVLATGCKKDDEENVPSLNGTYQGSILVLIPGIIGDYENEEPAEIEATFTVTDESKLSTTLQILIAEGLPPLSLSLSIEFIDKQTFKNATAKQDGETVGTITGTGFKVKALTVPITGVGTFALAGANLPIQINGVSYHGFQGEIQGEEGGGTGIAAMLIGTVSGAQGEILVGQTLPVVIVLQGEK
jgi:hypothetical protein